MKRFPSTFLTRSNLWQLLFKANRYNQVKDFYTPSALIVKTITFDRDSHRSRDARPGDRTIYDLVHSDDTNLRVLSSVDGESSTLPKNMAYAEDDAVEDAVLFPEDIPVNSTVEMGTAALNSASSTLTRTSGFSNALQPFESGDREYFMKKFACKPCSDESDLSEGEGEERGPTRDADEERLESSSTRSIDGDDEREDDASKLIAKQVADEFQIPSVPRKRSVRAVSFASSLIKGTSEGERKNYGTEIKDLALWAADATLRNPEDKDMHDQFMEFVDKERARGRSSASLL